MIPADAFKILDIGCGGGTLINQLKKNIVVGVDLSRIALRKDRALKILASASWLPFRDRSFDCTICTGVLEHLDNAVHKNAIMENLRKSLCMCQNCRNKFHAYLHKRSYDIYSLRKYFAGFKLLKLLLFNGRDNYCNSILLKIKQDVYRSYCYNPKAIGPRCGYKFSSGEPPSLPIINKTVDVICTGTNFLLKVIMRLLKRNNPTSLVVLMKKQDNSPFG